MEESTAGGRRRLSTDAQRVNPVIPVHVWRAPAGSAVDLQIVTHLAVYSTLHEHATGALPDETGGFLLGRVGFDEGNGCWNLEIDEAIPIDPVEQNPVHFTFTWKDVDRVRSYREQGEKALIGWYHSHPDMGIFLSDTDLEKTHRVLFAEPFQIALVYDPVRGRAGYFHWEGPQAIDASPADWREFEIAVRSPVGRGRLLEETKNRSAGTQEPASAPPQEETLGREREREPGTDPGPRPSSSEAAEEPSYPAPPPDRAVPGWGVFFLGLCLGMLLVMIAGYLHLYGWPWR